MNHQFLQSRLRQAHHYSFDQCHRNVIFVRAFQQPNFSTLNVSILKENFMTISLLIRSLNEGAHLGRLLEGVTRQTVQPTEIVVVDSGSTDNTLDIAERFGARIIPIDKANFTYGRALNLGVSAAVGDIVLIASAHVYPIFTTWIERMQSAFNEQTVSLVYGRQVGDHRSKFSERRLFEQWFPPESAADQKSYFCNNANCAVRRKDLLKYPYDESLTGLEDIAWAKALLARGGRLAYDALAEVAHVHEESWRQVRQRYMREAWAMRQIDSSIRLSIYDLIKLPVTAIFQDFLHARQQGVELAALPQIVAFRLNQFAGTFLGHRVASPQADLVKSRLYGAARNRRMLAAQQTALKKVEYGKTA